MAVYVVIGAKGGTGREIVKRLIEKPASEVSDPEASSYTSVLDICLEQTSSTTISMKIGIGSPGAGARSEHHPCWRFAGRRASQDPCWRCKVMGVFVCVCIRCLLACVHGACVFVCVCVIVCGGHYFFICNPRTRAHGSSLLHDIIRGRQSACRDISVSSMR